MSGWEAMQQGAPDPFFAPKADPLSDPSSGQGANGRPGLSIDIPTAVTLAEGNRLRELARGKRVLEVGSLLGYSTVLMAQVAKHVVSVDPHEGYPASNPRPTLWQFRRNIFLHGVADKVTPMIGTDDVVLPLLDTRQFGLVFIDGTGEYDMTLAAMRRAVPLLRYCGALAVHDCGHPDWPGAMDAAETFAREGRRTFELIDRLAVFTGTWPPLTTSRRAQP